MVIAAGGVALPDLDQRLGHGLAVLVEHAALLRCARPAARPCACLVRSFSQRVEALALGSDGPVISDRVCGSTIAGFAGERPTVDL